MQDYGHSVRIAFFGIKTSERISAFDRVASHQLIGLDFIRFD